MGASWSADNGSCTKPKRSDSGVTALLRVPSLRYLKRRRGSVSAESGGVKASGKRTVVPKTKEEEESLRAVINDITIFRDLDEGQVRRLMDAMTQRKVRAGEVVISQGEVGDFFYAVQSGRFAAKKGEEVKFVYDGSGSFGELALLYNAPRAATVVAETDGVLWTLDRTTFRALVVGGWEERRKQNEALLRGMSLFADLTDVQRAAIADCLAAVTFKQGDVIIKQGQLITSTSKFYIVQEGQVDCFRTGWRGIRELTRSACSGDVFGEVALLTKGPRQADCVAATEVVKCLQMPRDAFERLMGPVEGILRKQIEVYKRMDAELRRSTGP